ncbi:DNA-directed RNA polymerase 2 [Cryptosporidium bovis]|uniref:DNA-directed RNA polymerase 2 n=1 Tax=Cryptosporidium bovis TaxID=310047 RepID=UPI00351A83DA|nr:DNA-directed RNA polymerase 2 [Cryptosporidium bovis]
MDNSDNRLFRARRTLCEMLEDRGYIVSSQDKEEDFATFKEKFESHQRLRSRMLMVASHRQDQSKRIICYFADESKKTGVKPIRDIVEKMDEHSIQRAILISQNVLTAHAKVAILDAAPKHYIESFLENELLVNITKHELVPRHILLSDEDKAQLLERYKIKETQLPRIQFADPVARYFGLSKGQVVKIIRPSETAGRYVTYRLVV